MSDGTERESVPAVGESTESPEAPPVVEAAAADPAADGVAVEVPVAESAVAEAITPAPEVPTPIEVEVPVPAEITAPSDNAVEEVVAEVIPESAASEVVAETASPATTEAPAVSEQRKKEETNTVAAPPVPTMSGAEGLKARRAKRAARIERIYELRKLGRPITNNDVQLHLHVSHKTATTYLNTLVIAGKLFAEGKGRGRIYRFV